MTDRETYMRRQEEDHDLLRMRTRTPLQPRPIIRPLSDAECDWLADYMADVRAHYEREAAPMSLATILMLGAAAFAVTWFVAALLMSFAS